MSYNDRAVSIEGRPEPWCSIRHAAKTFGRTERRVRSWCINGFFSKRGIRTYQDIHKRWWIALHDSPKI